MPLRSASGVAAEESFLVDPSVGDPYLWTLLTRCSRRVPPDVDDHT